MQRNLLKRLLAAAVRTMQFRYFGHPEGHFFNLVIIVKIKEATPDPRAIGKTLYPGEGKGSL